MKKNILICFLACLIISCGPSTKEKALKKMTDSIKAEQIKIRHRKDSLNEIILLMEHGATEKEAVNAIKKTDSIFNAIEQDIKNKMK